MTLILLTGIAVTNAQEERLSGTSGQQQSLVAKTTAASDLLAKRLKRLTAPRSYETAEGSRVTISSDAPLNDYTAHRSDDRFHVVIPQASLTDTQIKISGRGFTDAQIEQRGSDVVLSFRLQPGATARVDQKFNRLEIIFNAPSRAIISVSSDVELPVSASPNATTEESKTPGITPLQDLGPAPAVTASAATSAAASTSAQVFGPKAALMLPPEKARPVRVPRFEKSPVIDGKLDDEVWSRAAVLGNFYQVQPGDNIEPS